MFFSRASAGYTGSTRWMTLGFRVMAILLFQQFLSFYVLLRLATLRGFLILRQQLRQSLLRLTRFLRIRSLLLLIHLQKPLVLLQVLLDLLQSGFGLSLRFRIQLLDSAARVFLALQETCWTSRNLSSISDSSGGCRHALLFLQLLNLFQQFCAYLGLLLLFILLTTLAGHCGLLAG